MFRIEPTIWAYDFRLLPSRRAIYHNMPPIEGYIEPGGTFVSKDGSKSAPEGYFYPVDSEDAAKTMYNMRVQQEITIQQDVLDEIKACLLEL